jgi:DNA polymerase III delta prime subunit
MINELLTQKLKPKKFEHIILPARIREALDNGNIQQNFLFHGTQGIGKTSTAEVLSMQAMGHADFKINCSEDTGVDVIRDKITNMCSSLSVMDGPNTVKVIILDEIEGVSDQFFKALRGVMDKFKNCRFIATTNYINKVPDPVKSRFELLNFDLINSQEVDEVLTQWKNRIGIIFNKLDIEIDDVALDEFIDRNFPDMRSTLNKIQSFQIRKVSKITIDNIKQLNWSFDDVYKLVIDKPDAYNNYKFLMTEYSNKVEDVIAALGTDFVEWLKVNEPDKIKFVPVIIIEGAKHQAMRNQVIDPSIVMLSLVFTIQKLLNS